MARPAHAGRTGKRRAPPVRAARGPLDFAAILTRFEVPLLRYVGQIMGPDHEAPEEVVQEAFLRLHRQVGRHGASSVENLSSWLFRVAHNLAVSKLRRRELEKKLRDEAVREARADQPSPLAAADTLDEVVRRELCRRVMAELDTLPQDQKQVLLLKVIEGFTFREIGEITGQAVSNVAYRINGGLRELARRLRSADLM